MMQVSIWQQFSSNHSSRFTVVGEFETPEAAQKAADILRQFAETIRQWYAENPDADEDWNAGGPVLPIPPELEFSRQHNIEWGDHAHDWLFGEAVPVTHIARLVFVNGTESDFGAKPLDDVLERLGGNVKVDGTIIYSESDDGWLTDEAYFSVSVSVTCLAPDASIAMATSARLCAERLSITTMSPGPSVGARTCVT